MNCGSGGRACLLPGIRWPARARDGCDRRASASAESGHGPRERRHQQSGLLLEIGPVELGYRKEEWHLGRCVRPPTVERSGHDSGAPRNRRGETHWRQPARRHNYPRSSAHQRGQRPQAHKALCRQHSLRRAPPLRTAPSGKSAVDRLRDSRCWRAATSRPPQRPLSPQARDGSEPTDTVIVTPT